jgi:hypothetical protein
MRMYPFNRRSNNTVKRDTFSDRKPYRWRLYCLALMWQEKAAKHAVMASLIKHALPVRAQEKNSFKNGNLSGYISV